MLRRHRAGGGGGGQAAKDANGDAVKSKKWLATHLAGDRQLTQGLKARLVTRRTRRAGRADNPRAPERRHGARNAYRSRVACCSAGLPRRKRRAARRPSRRREPAGPSAPRRAAASGLLTAACRVQGDATYLIVKNDGTLADFGLNAVCTHLGCVVPWNKARMRRWCPAMCLLA